MISLTIDIAGDRFRAELNPELAPDTVQKIVNTLPIETTINTWGDEFYFGIPVSHPVENGVESLQVGDLAFWPPANAFCIFFGLTPMSSSLDNLVPASAVSPLGRIENPEKLKKYRDGDTIRITQA